MIKETSSIYKIQNYSIPLDMCNQIFQLSVNSD